MNKREQAVRKNGRQLTIMLSEEEMKEALIVGDGAVEQTVNIGTDSVELVIAFPGTIKVPLAKYALWKEGKRYRVGLLPAFVAACNIFSGTRVETCVVGGLVLVRVKEVKKLNNEVTSNELRKMNAESAEPLTELSDEGFDPPEDLGVESEKEEIARELSELPPDITLEDIREYKKQKKIVDAKIEQRIEAKRTLYKKGSWTAEENRRLAIMWPKRRLSEISAALGRMPNSCENQASALNLGPGFTLA